MKIKKAPEQIKTFKILNPKKDIKTVQKSPGFKTISEKKINTERREIQRLLG